MCTRIEATTLSCECCSNQKPSPHDATSCPTILSHCYLIRTKSTTLQGASVGTSHSVLCVPYIEHFCRVLTMKCVGDHASRRCAMLTSLALFAGLLSPLALATPVVD